MVRDSCRKRPVQCRPGDSAASISCDLALRLPALSTHDASNYPPSRGDTPRRFYTCPTSPSPGYEPRCDARCRARFLHPTTSCIERQRNCSSMPQPVRQRTFLDDGAPRGLADGHHDPTEVSNRCRASFSTHHSAAGRKHSQFRERAVLICADGGTCACLLNRRLGRKVGLSAESGGSARWASRNAPKLAGPFS